MNEKIFGNKTALLTLIQLYHHNEVHARGVATDLYCIAIKNLDP